MGGDHEQDLVIGVQSVLLDQKWLPTTFITQQKHFQLDLSDGQGVLEDDGIIVCDLASHKASEQSNLLQAFPSAFRGYMEVPLLTSSGYIFGSLCVADSVARLPHKADLHQLQDIAALIVNHLDTLRLKADYSRAQRLLQGLASFIEGEQSLSDWSSKTSGQDFIPKADTGNQQSLSAIKSRPDFSRSKTKRSGSVSSTSVSLENDIFDTAFWPRIKLLTFSF